jgi:hypothetical protein
MRLLSTGVPTLALALFASCSAGAEQCKTVDSHLMSALFIQGCTSPVGFCTRGTVASGPLAGSFEFTALTSTALNQAPVFYSGVVVYTTKHGTLTVTDSGMFNPMNGSFLERQDVTGGTVAFVKSVGMLTSQGTGIFLDIGGTLTLVGFNGSVAGRVCRGRRGPGEKDDGTNRSMALVDASSDLED